MPENTRLRFTILEHDHPFLHWDLLMENGDRSALNSWRLLQKPVRGPWITSESLPDHRMIYLDYEGPVSNNRGCVRRFCGGSFCPDTNSADSTMTTFLLHDCAMATKLVCRDDGQTSPVWQFV